MAGRLFRMVRGWAVGGAVAVARHRGELAGFIGVRGHSDVGHAAKRRIPFDGVIDRIGHPRFWSLSPEREGRLLACNGLGAHRLVVAVEEAA